MIDNLLSELPKPKNDNPFITLRDLLNFKNMSGALLDEDENNPYIYLKKLVNHENVSVGTLATAIENCGIYTWDKYGRFKLFQKDTPEAQQALLLLQNIFEYENDPTPGNSDKQHPLDASNDWDDLYWGFGWAVKELPNLKTIKDGQLEMLRKEKPIGKREESNNLKIIGALLKIIKGEMTGIKKHPNYTGEAPMILDMEADFSKENEGFSKRNLETRFAEAKQALK